MKKLTTLFFYAGAFVCSFASAQTKSDSSKSLSDSIKTVTITATRTEKDVMDVGRSVTVLSGDDLKQPGVNTVAELLSQQEGIFIVGTGQNPGAIQSLFLRGADNNHTSIMIDGVPLTDPSTDHGEIDLSELSLSDVDKIEIVRGSHSTLYGSSAIGGVINIITKKNYTPGIHLSASVTGGEFGPKTSDFEENVVVDYTFKNGFYLTGGYHRIDDKGLNATVDTITHPLYYQMNPDRDNFNKADPFAKIGFYNKNWDIYAEYKNTIQNSDADASAFTDLKNAMDHFVRDFYTYGATYKLNNNLSFQYTGSYSHDFRVYTQGLDTIDAYGDVSAANDFYTGTSISNRFQINEDIKNCHFIIGAEQRVETMSENTFDYSGTSFYGDTTYVTSLDALKPKQTTNSGYAQADVNGGILNSKLSPFSLLLGIRYTSTSLSGNNVSYDLNPYYKINPNTTLYLSYSTGFSTPSLYELYAPNKYGDSLSTSVTLGNSKLTPETSGSFEVGIKRKVSNSLFITVSWFETVVNNHIDYVTLWSKAKPIDSLGYGYNLGDTYLNLGQEITSGFEMNVFLKLSPTLDMTGNVSLLTSTLKYDPNNIDLSQTHGDWVQIYDGGEFLNGPSTSTGLLRRPGALANFSLIWHPVQKLALTLHARYIGDRYDAQYDYSLGPYGALAFVNVGDYTLLDASASYEICKQFSITARGENLFNTTYSEILGYTTRGRSFYLNLRFAF